MKGILLAIYNIKKLVLSVLLLACLCSCFGKGYEFRIGMTPITGIQHTQSFDYAKDRLADADADAKVYGARLERRY